MDQKPTKTKRTRAIGAAETPSETPLRRPRRGRKALAVQAGPPENTGPARDPKTGRVSGGNRGNKGGTGRPPKALKARQAYIAEIASGRAVEIAGDDTHPYWRTVYERSLEYEMGKPEQRVKMGGAIQLTIRKVSE